MRLLRVTSAAALCAAALLTGTAPAAADGPCVRTPGSLYWEACVDRGDCTVYVWSTMPPAICA